MSDTFVSARSVFSSGAAPEFRAVTSGDRRESSEPQYGTEGRRRTQNGVMADRAQDNASSAGVVQLDIASLYEQYGHHVYKRCLYFLRAPQAAEDAMHEVFIRALENQDGFRGASSPLTWIVRIATNYCLNQLRSERAGWRERFRRSVLAEDSHTVIDVDRLETSQLVRSLLCGMKPEIAEAAVYYYVDEMSQADAAVAAHCSIPTLRKRLREFVKRARKTLVGVDPDVVFERELP